MLGGIYIRFTLRELGMFYYCNLIKFWAALFVALAVLIFPPAGLWASADKGSPLIFCPANFVPGSKSSWQSAGSHHIQADTPLKNVSTMLDVN